MPLTLASSPLVTAALVVLFGVPVVLFLWWAADEDGVRRRLGGLGRYLPVIIPAYAAAIGVVGWLFRDPHTLMLGGVVAAFTLKPVYDAWRRKRRS
ncbi:MAG: hypothetical protein B7Y45_07780 [Sphingomonas sp. 28-66-16]|nr:MAG: hypothetical protein B7Y45_07780 [Sphingomonas sp. 28-66-16]